MKKRIGKYELIKEIGRGGMGEVYLARNTETGQEIALKILPPELTRNRQFVERFRREAKVVSQLNHPHIIQVYEVGQQDGMHFIAMEYLAGRSLGSLLKQRKRLSIPEAVTIITDIADALDFAHSRGIIHRDIKPENILADEQGEFKVMDFGIAHVEEGTQLTVTGSIIGTPEYMSPEQASGAKVDQRADIYSLGIVFYELLTGRVPFRAETAVELMQMHLTRIPESPKALNPEIPGKLASVISKMVEKKVGDRYASFRHVINAMSQAIPQDLRTVVDAGARAIREKPARKEERPGPRVRERVILQVPTRMRVALALSIILNLALFAYLLFRPTGSYEAAQPMQQSFGIRGPMFAPPAVSDGVIYLGAEDGTLYACDILNGEVKWTFKAADKITAAPVVDADRVYVGSWDKHVYALDTSLGGAVIWKVNTGASILAAPRLSDGTLYVCTRDGGVFAIDAATGKTKWNDDSGSSVKLSPTLQDGILFVASEDRKLLAYDAVGGKKRGEFITQRVKTPAIPVGRKLFYVEFDDAAGRDELRAIEVNPFTFRKQLQWGPPEMKVPLVPEQER